MKKTNIVIMVDVKKRDLPAYVAIKKKVEENNHANVWLTRNGLEVPTAVAKKADVVVITQCLSKSLKTMALKLKKNGSKVVVLPTEGFPVIKEDRLLFASGGENSYRECLDRLYCWNKQMYEYSVEYSDLDKENIVICNVPRLDLYDDQYRVFRNKINDKEEESRLTILFPTNFTDADAGYYGRIDDLVKEYNDHGHQSQLQSNDGVKEYVNKRVEQDIKSRDLCVQFIEKIESQYDCKIIIKPHPFERLDYWVEKFSDTKLRNIEISVNDYIWGSLEQSDIVIARSCTTQIEAFLLDKCTAELVLNPGDLYATEESALGNYVIRNMDDFDQMMNKYNNQSWRTNEVMDQRKYALAVWRGTVDNDKSIDIVAKDLAKIARYNFGVCQLSLLDKVKEIAKYYLLCLFDFKLHDILVQKNRKLKILDKSVYVDSRGRIDKHMHAEDVEEIMGLFDVDGSCE